MSAFPSAISSVSVLPLIDCSRKVLSKLLFRSQQNLSQFLLTSFPSNMFARQLTYTWNGTMTSGCPKIIFKKSTTSPPLITASINRYMYSAMYERPCNKTYATKLSPLYQDLHSNIYRCDGNVAFPVRTLS